MKDNSPQYLRAILLHCGDAIITTDAEGRVVEWNPAAERMLGWRRSDIVGRPAAQIWVEPEERGRVKRLLERKGQVTDYETRLRMKDGRTIEVSFTMSELKDDAGRVVGTVCIAKDVRRRKKMERDLIRLAITDGLTGLFNRAHFNGELIAAVEDARRDAAPLSVAMADLDGFKRYNDGQGHQAGDGALRKIGRAALDSIRRKDDGAFRYGGDEFAFLFPGVGGAEALAAAERVRAAIERTAGPAITASLGVATLRDGEGSREVLQRADEAMYRAKAAGGNRVAGA
jgi:diguanylate cyclase (GGDEF)-like protein/PAS domain S-box-containing protein